jgi:hypothetical protein
LVFKKLFFKSQYIFLIFPNKIETQIIFSVQVMKTSDLACNACDFEAKTVGGLKIHKNKIHSTPLQKSPDHLQTRPDLDEEPSKEVSEVIIGIQSVAVLKSHNKSKTHSIALVQKSADLQVVLGPSKEVSEVAIDTRTLVCNDCDFEGKTVGGLKIHKRKTHFSVQTSRPGDLQDVQDVPCKEVSGLNQNVQVVRKKRSLSLSLEIDEDQTTKTKRERRHSQGIKMTKKNREIVVG